MIIDWPHDTAADFLNNSFDSLLKPLRADFDGFSESIAEPSRRSPCCAGAMGVGGITLKVATPRNAAES